MVKNSEEEMELGFSNNMKGEEDIDIELRLSCSTVMEKSPLNLFSCSETTIGDAESSGLFKGAAYMFSSPEASELIQAPKKKVFKEFREQDLLGRLMEGSRSSSSSEEENSVTSCSAVDCTLSLGMPNTVDCTLSLGMTSTVLFSEQPGEVQGLLMFPDGSSLPAVRGDEDRFAWMKLQDMFRRQRIVERGLHVVGLGSSGIEGPPSGCCISPKITNGDRDSSYNTMAVPFSELSSTSNNIHGPQFYKSCWNTTTTSSNATSWQLDSSQKLMGSKNILPFGNRPRCGTVFRSQVSARLPTNNNSSTNYINNGYGGSSRVVHQQPQKQKRNAISQDAKGNCMLRECAKCKTTTTPLWRNGPKGAKVSVSRPLIFEYCNKAQAYIEKYQPKFPSTEICYLFILFRELFNAYKNIYMRVYMSCFLNAPLIAPPFEFVCNGNMDSL